MFIVTTKHEDHPFSLPILASKRSALDAFHHPEDLVQTCPHQNKFPKCALTEALAEKIQMTQGLRDRQGSLAGLDKPVAFRLGNQPWRGQGRLLLGRFS